jgi:hypothetical protein
MTEINSEKSSQIPNDGSKLDEGGATRNPDDGGIIRNPGDGVNEETPIRRNTGERSLKTLVDSQKLVRKLLTKRPTEKRSRTIQKFIEIIKNPSSKISTQEFYSEKFKSRETTQTFLNQIQQHESELEQFKSRIKGKDTELETK